MARASFMQTSFLGGVWSNHMQGRMDSQQYKQALNVCQNYIPIEEGTLVRRPGSQYMGHTRNGSRAQLLAFDYSRVSPYQIECTDRVLRFWRGALLRGTATPLNIVSVSTTGTVTTNEDLPSHWANGDHVYFQFGVRADGTCASTTLENKQWKITKLTSTTFTIRDVLNPNTALSGTQYTAPTVFSEGADEVYKIMELTTSYLEADLPSLRVAQDEDSAVILHADYIPKVVSAASAATDYLFGIADIDLLDGPYLDINADAVTTLTPSAVTGSITLTLSAITDVNDGAGWASTDVGRLVRLRSSPATWLVGSTYAVGDTVTGSDDGVYVSLAASNTGNDPTVDLTKWSVSPTSHAWSWAEITAYTSTTVVTATIRGDDLLNATAIPLNIGVRLGLYSDTTGWPTIAGYHEDRLWLAGQTVNRIDGSKVGDKYNFAPTTSDGTVADDNAVSATAFSTHVNLFRWMITDEQGLLLGTQNGEWRCRSSGNDDPITPFSIQMREVSSYGSAEQAAVKASKAVIFTQRQRRKTMEFMGVSAADYHANNLTLAAEHVTASGVAEIAYVQEPTPILWSRLDDGSLTGCSYMRTPEKSYAAWHTHPLANGRLVKSISSGPSFDTLTDRLYFVSSPTTDLSTDTHWVEMITDLYDGNVEELCHQFVDHSVKPSCMSISGSTLTISGLHHLVGLSVTGSIGGIDIGDHTVTTAGQITVTLGAFGTGDGDGLTEAYLQSLDTDFGDCAIIMPYTTETSATTTNDVAVGARAWYEAEATVDPADGNALLIDNERGYIITLADTSNTYEPGFAIYERSGSGDRIKELTVTELGVAGISHGAGKALAIDKKGRIITVTASANTAVYSIIDPTLGTTIASIGTSSGDLTPNETPGNPEFATTWNIDDDGNIQTYLIASTTLNTPTVIHRLTAYTGDVPTSLLGGSSVTIAKTNGDNQYVCGGPPVQNRGLFFHINTFRWGIGSTQSWVVKKILIGQDAGVGSATLITIAPSDFDATWTKTSAYGGSFVDQVDGNLVICAQTDEVVTYKTAMIKVNSVTGAIMWRATVDASESAWGSPNSRKLAVTTRSRYLHYDASEVIYIWDLTDGSMTSKDYSTPAISVITGQQISDDETEGGQVAFEGQFNENGSGATMVGTYAEANSSWTNKFMALYANLTNGVVAYDNIETPGTIGMTYTSRAQLLRPDFGNDAGAANGPSFGKTRRIDQFVASLYRTREINFGTDFDNLHKVQQRTAGGTYVNAPTLLTGIIQSQIENDYSFEAQICWEQTRPYPGILTAVGGFISTQDR